MDATNERTYEVFATQGAAPIKSWTLGVPFEPEAKAQLERVASLPFIHPWVAAMPDVHLGKGATIGSVIPTHRAVIPAAVGVDIGYGMMDVRTSILAGHLPDDLRPLRSAIEASVPHGRTDRGGRNDRGAWSEVPPAQQEAWSQLKPGNDRIVARHPKIGRGRDISHLGTLGTVNHFIEVCLDERGSIGS